MAVSVGALPAYAQLKHYDSDTPSFWQHPPPDWFLGDETEAQKGLAPPSGPATPTDAAELEQDLSKIKLPPGFKIELWASGIPQARQMAWGDDGTLFVGSFGATNVYAVKDEGGKRTVKTIIKGLNMPTGVAFENGSLYVVAIDKLLRYDDAEKNLDNMPKPVVVYDDMPPYHVARMEVSRRRSQRGVLHRLRPALQHRHPAHQRVPDPQGELYQWPG